ncbi:MAG: ribonuclease J [Myxococcales bacterium]|nr:ribonuclease J [Myxococcales bacterium]
MNTLHTPATLHITPLGGFGEIGMNCLLVQCGEALLMLDCGVQFCAEPRLGVDYYHPAFDALQHRAQHLEAILLTHGHEDHIAALPHLPPAIDAPVYGGPYTLRLAQSRLSEYGAAKRFALNALSPGKVITTPTFRVTALPVTHSIVDSYGYLIEAGERRIFVTGDYRHAATSDANSGDSDTPAPMAEVMIGDSTGALETDVGHGEPALLDTVAHIFDATPGRIYLALFSSNIALLHRLAAMAGTKGRRVAFSGRSVQTNIELAASVGRALPHLAQRVAPHNIDTLPRDATAAFISGTQGEPRSGLQRLATGTHPHLDVRPGDAVVISSRVIPGNEVPVSQMIDNFLIRGARVYHPGTHPTLHVSGHGTVSEIQAAIRRVAPLAYLPAHGTYAHLVAAEEIARRSGVPQTAVLRNGDTATWDGHTLTAQPNALPTGRVAVAQQRPLTHGNLTERAIMAEGGYLFIEAAQQPHADNAPIRIVRWQSCGAFDPATEAQVRHAVAVRLNDTASDEAWTNEDAFNRLKNQLRRFLQKKWGAVPYLELVLKRGE